MMMLREDWLFYWTLATRIDGIGCHGETSPKQAKADGNHAIGRAKPLTQEVCRLHEPCRRPHRHLCPAVSACAASLTPDAAKSLLAVDAPSRLMSFLTRRSPFNQAGGSQSSSTTAAPPPAARRRWRAWVGGWRIILSSAMERAGLTASCKFRSAGPSNLPPDSPPAWSESIPIASAFA